MSSKNDLLAIDPLHRLNHRSERVSPGIFIKTGAVVHILEKLGGRVVNSSEVRGALQIVVTFKGATIILRGQRTGEQVNEKNKIQWGTDHFGFRVDGDFDGFCEDLKKNGVAFSIDPMDFGPTLRIAFIDAPDGVSIELLQRKG